MRIRVTEDGETHTYTIKEYKQITVDGAYTTPDGVYVCNGIIIFDCQNTLNFLLNCTFWRFVA